MYDENAWNDLAYLLNGKTVEIAGCLLEYHLGHRPPRIRDDGYEIVTPPEDQYNLARAQVHIYGNSVQAAEAIEPVRAVPGAVGPWTFPALAWLDDPLGRRARPASWRSCLSMSRRSRCRIRPTQPWRRIASASSPNWPIATAPI
jgi:hypothetical protein